MPWLNQLATLALIPVALASGYLADIHTRDDEMDMSGPKEFHPINPGAKTFHWILTLFVLLIVPSISGVLAIANRINIALPLQFVCTAYSVVETLFIDFPDPDGHENKTSKGTSFFLSLLLGVTVFVGTIQTGSNLFMNKFYKNYSPPQFMSKIYKTCSVLSVLTGWVRVCLAPVALFGFCYGIHTGQCIAHGIMGSSFVAYGFILIMVLIVPWIRKHGPDDAPRRSQEFYDSTIMCIWGIVNTFTEHRWGKEPWNHGDYQHTAMGIIWWAGGLLGIWMTCRKDNTRSFIPAVLLIFTGWAMSEHVQHLEISTKVHAMFGITLMSGGFSRIVEISFVLWDKNCSESGKIYSFQYLPPLCLVLSGILFMAANEEQLVLVQDLGADHSSYIMVASAAAFVIFLWFMLLIWLYLRLVGYDENGEIGLNLDAAYTRAAAEEFELAEYSDDDNVRRL